MRLPRVTILLTFIVATCNRSSPELPEEPAPVDAAGAPVTYETVEVVPKQATAVGNLSTDGHLHHELLRIRRDFGKEHFTIALDAWVKREGSDVDDVRLWWSRTDKDNERSPFGPKSTKHFDIRYSRDAANAWHVDLVSDRKVFRFDIEAAEDGKVGAFATVVASSGRRIPHCRTTQGTLVARRFLGAPVGIRRLEVTCTADDGAEVSGRIATTRG